MEKSDLKLSGISGQPDHEPLESATECSNRYNCTTFSSGAGANAGPRLDMRLVGGADPLSELVWSPQKGLSVKYADGSCFSKEKPRILWCPEASNIVVSSSIDNSTCLITSSTSRNISEGARKEIPINFLTSSTGIMQLSISSDEREPACVQPEKLETLADLSSALEKEGLQCDQEGDMLRSRVGNNYSSNEQIITAGGDDDRNPTTRTEEEDDVPAKLEAGTSIKNVHKVEKHEQSSAHDLQSSHGRKGFFVAANSEWMESSVRVKINSPRGHELVAEGKMPSGSETPSSSRIRRYQMKGKGRALSDGIPDGRTLAQEGDSSHDSVESCNNAGGLYSAGKKQFHFEQTLIVGSKRLKRHVQDSPGSSSLIRKDSSFMNWISNMMKGLSSYRERSVPSLALTLVDPDEGHKVPEQRLVGLDKTTGSAGFQTYFDSLHRPKRKAQEILPLNPADQAKEYRAMELDDMVSNVHTSPQTGPAETGTFHTLFKLPNSKSNERARQNHVGRVFQARDSSKEFLGARRDIGITASMGNKGSMNLGTEKGRNGTISYLSHDKGEGGLDKKNCFELPFEGKENRAYGSVSGPMTSLWITRFTPKFPAPLSDQDEAPTCPIDGMTMKYPTNQLSSSNSGKELRHSGNSGVLSPCAQTHRINAVNSLCLSKAEVFPVDKSDCQQDPVFPSPRIKQSEVAASVLARRLDASKHMKPSDANQHALTAPRHPLDFRASSASTSKLKLKDGDGCGRSVSNGGDCHFQAANAPSTCDENGPPKGKDVIRRQNEPVSNIGIPSSSTEGKSSTHSFTPIVCLLDKHLSDDPKSIFDAVKRLQLSRANVLQWMHSHMPLSCLDGLFLRLRLGKSDARLGRARYHVACITGVQERVPQNSKFSISVDVGGISCLVESRYISNQDFLEDELVAWWTSTSNGGGKVPSQEDLRLKFEEKKMLGL